MNVAQRANVIHDSTQATFRCPACKVGLLATKSTIEPMFFSNGGLYLRFFCPTCNKQRLVNSRNFRTISKVRYGEPDEHEEQNKDPLQMELEAMRNYSGPKYYNE